ncbi:MAG: protoporphyrinogen oxidase HemJ, partial [Oleiphilaceae bacterium]|nr:protoporphyrinogen oxidase HemJ [Oleiphilaceae bacterium]
AFHVIFMVTWFAGLFYLPRLFVYHAQATDNTSLERFKLMERRLMIMTHIGAGLTLVFGFWLLLGWRPDLIKAGWLHAKLTLVVLLYVYMILCGRYMRQFRNDNNQHTARFYRLFNEIPGIFLIAIIVLAVVKPF